MEHFERRYGWDAWQGQRRARLGQSSFHKALPGTRGPGKRASPCTAPRFPSPSCSAAYYPRCAARWPLNSARKSRLKPCSACPANANTNQRFLTVDAFRRAGFQCWGFSTSPGRLHRIRPPSKVERPHSGATISAAGTFDVSLVSMADGTHTVLASEGISNLGGDDFDIVLAELAAGREVLHSLSLAEMFRLDEELPASEEALHPNSRKIVIDLDVAPRGTGPGRRASGPTSTSIAVPCSTSRSPWP